MHLNLSIAEDVIEDAPVPELDIRLDFFVAIDYIQRRLAFLIILFNDAVQVKRTARVFNMLSDVGCLFSGRRVSDIPPIHGERIGVNQHAVTDKPHPCGGIPQKPFPPKEVQQHRNADSEEEAAIKPSRAFKLDINVEEPVNGGKSLRKGSRVVLVPQIDKAAPHSCRKQHEPQNGAVDDDIFLDARHCARIAPIVEIVKQPDNCTRYPQQPLYPETYPLMNGEVEEIEIDRFAEYIVGFGGGCVVHKLARDRHSRYGIRSFLHRAIQVTDGGIV